MTDIARTPDARNITITPDPANGVIVTTVTDPSGHVISTTSDPMPPEDIAANTITAATDQALDGLRQIANSSGTLTAAQLSNAVRLLTTVTIRLVRLQLRKFDGTN